MLKEVLQALPVYTMSIFQLSKGICQELSKLFAQFWWNKSAEEQKLHWVRWEKLTNDKEKGGLSFKELQAFNFALLGKKVWRVLTNPNLLMSKVFKYKYFPHTDLFHATCKNGDSWMWRNWIEATKFMREGCCWQAGNGGRINVWEDKWVKDAPFRRVSSCRPEGCSVGKVKDLLNFDGVGWNEHLRVLFNPADIQAIRQTPISVMGLSDKMVRPLTKNDQYSVKSGYKYVKEWRSMLHERVETSSGRCTDESLLWNRIWSMNVKKKIQHFLWGACHNKLSVGVNLRRRGINVDAMCSQCGEDMETEEHLFFHCPRAKLIWKLAPVQWDDLQSVTGSIKEWWFRQGEAGKNGELEDRHEFTAFLWWHM